MPDFFKSPVAIPATGAGMPAAPLCPGDLPLVLLPVRLETRFFTLADGSTELRVRVFPDKIHLDSHEPELTADEQTWGQHYWEQNWRAGDIRPTVRPRLPTPGASWRIGSAPAARRGSRACCSRPMRPNGRTRPHRRGRR